MNKKQAKAPSQSNRGKATNLYLRPDDLLHIRKLGAFLMQHGYRVSDSQVIRAACAITKPDSELLKAFQAVQAVDGRRK